MIDGAAAYERGLIRARTKAALAAAKARGVKLGNPNGARALRGKQVGNYRAVAKLKENAAQRAADLKDIVEDIRGSGITTRRRQPPRVNGVRLSLQQRPAGWILGQSLRGVQIQEGVEGEELILRMRWRRGIGGVRKKERALGNQQSRPDRPM